MDLELLKKDVISCDKCILARSRNHVIFGEGDRRAPVLIVGEAPGEDEDRIGRPFVGKSGQLLDKILDACGFNRTEHVYISNIVKCRPPGNRQPSPEEIGTCMPYLLKQIEIIKPEFLILLGATALKSFFGPNMKITKTRGHWLQWNGHKVMAVYHPSALLRNPALKKDTWEDYKKIVLKYREIINPSHYSAYV